MGCSGGDQSKSSGANPLSTNSTSVSADVVLPPSLLPFRSDRTRVSKGDEDEVYETR